MLIVVKILQYTYFTIFIFIIFFTPLSFRLRVILFHIWGNNQNPISFTLHSQDQHFYKPLTLFYKIPIFSFGRYKNIKTAFLKCLEGIGVDFNVIDFYCKYMLTNIIRINFRMQIQISQKILYIIRQQNKYND